jgi:hypothetical protein
LVCSYIIKKMLEVVSLTHASLKKWILKYFVSCNPKLTLGEGIKGCDDLVHKCAKCLPHYVDMSLCVYEIVICDN